MVWDLWTLLVALVVPRSRAKNWLLSRRPGHEVHPSASIGPTVVVRVRTMRLGPGSEMAFGNVLWGLTRFELEDNAYIGNLNWFSASPEFTAGSTDPDVGTLVLHREALMTNRHRFDCSGGVYVGELAALAGYGTNILTHSYSFRDMHQHAEPTRIGRQAFVAARSFLLMGVSVADGVIVAAGSVVPASLDQERGFYAGSPARLKRDMPADLPWYARHHRTGGRVHTSPASTDGTPADATS